MVDKPKTIMITEVRSPNTTDMYLTLMKNAIAYMLWDEVGSPIETFNYQRSLPKRLLVSSLVPLLKRRRFQLFRIQRWTDSQRENGGIYPAYAHTMIGMKRLDNLQSCIEDVIRNGIEGDLIETGVWRGGACIFMRAVLAAYGVKNRRNAPSGAARREVSRYYRERFSVPGDRGILVHSGTLAWRLAAQLAAANWSAPWAVVFQGRFAGANRSEVQGRCVYFENNIFPAEQMREVTSSADIGLALYDRNHPLEQRNGRNTGQARAVSQLCVAGYLRQCGQPRHSYASFKM